MLSPKLAPKAAMSASKFQSPLRPVQFSAGSFDNLLSIS